MAAAAAASATGASCATGGPSGAPAAPSSADKDDVLRILVASDMHLGYAERDPVRGDDSFVTFAECFELANAHQVDMVLLAPKVAKGAAGEPAHERHTRERLYALVPFTHVVALVVGLREKAGQHRVVEVCAPGSAEAWICLVHMCRDATREETRA